ncbi:MAG: tetratricopeptide repeat protein [Ignavibacteria bacterium]|nr:tetratricopeptide repeat protein [Ignavibacteria bacterium]
MTLELLTEILNTADTEIKVNGNFEHTEKLCREVLSALEQHCSVPEHDLLLLHSRALRLLSQSMRRRGKVEESLPIAKEALRIARMAKNDSDEALSQVFLGATYAALSEYPLALKCFNSALLISERSYDTSGIALALGNIGSIYLKLSDFTKAMEYCSRALVYEEELGNNMNIVARLCDIGGINFHLGDNTQALEYFFKAVALCEQFGLKEFAAVNIANIGNVYYELSDYTNALEFSYRALDEYEKLGAKQGVGTSLSNIGLIYLDLHDYPNALQSLTKALAIFDGIGYKYGIVNTSGNIGRVYSDREYEGYDAAKAEAMFLGEIAGFEELGVKDTSFSHKLLAELYEQEERWKEANEHNKKYQKIKEDIINEEAKKQALNFEQLRQAEQREKQLAIERARAHSTEELLHKTLPKSIADRVIRGETRIADHFDSASVLFADVVGFTKISAKMPPATVLGFMNFIFEHFDAIAAKYGCERIKTIGDGYMAVCGAPVMYLDHVERLARMALEMMKDITLPEEIRKHLPAGTLFHLRIGLHCGELTAGLIGTGKLAYDIYGDAVNTASRMESHGEAGKIHVSEEFMQAVVGDRSRPVPTTTNVLFVPFVLFVLPLPRER